MISRANRVVSRLVKNYEIVVMDGGSNDKTCQIAQAHGAKVYRQTHKGYGNAYKEGIERCPGKYILTLDADLSHDPSFIKVMYQNRLKGDIVLASRYLPNAYASMGLVRKIISRTLNQVFAYLLLLPIKDLSSGFRLYNRRIFDNMRLKGQGFDLLSEIIVKSHMQGWTILEVPYHYFPRKRGLSKFRFFKYALAHLKTLIRLWIQRNSLESVDYDDRAFNAKIPLQRYWQRKKYHIILDMLDRESPILDLGCGTCKTLEALPEAYGLDLDLARLRYRKRTNSLLICGDALYLPFKTATFKEIICSQIIEHLADTDQFLGEVERVLIKGGNLILATPDYSKRLYGVIEFFYKKLLPGAYADQHISPWTHDSICQKLKDSGFEIMEVRYICWTDMIIKAIKL